MNGAEEYYRGAVQMSVVRETPGSKRRAHSLRLEREREKVTAGFCHLMLSPAPRPQLHLCPWLPLCGLSLGPYLYSDEFSIPLPSTRTQLLGESLSAADLGRRALSQDNCLGRLYFNSVFTGDLLRVIRSFKRMSY